MEVHDSEGALLDAAVAAVRALDPDLLVGFEVQQGSLGFLVDRSHALQRGGDPLLRQLSRTPQVAQGPGRVACCLFPTHLPPKPCLGPRVLVQQ